MILGAKGNSRLTAYAISLDHGAIKVIDTPIRDTAKNPRRIRKAVIRAARKNLAPIAVLATPAYVAYKRVYAQGSEWRNALHSQVYVLGTSAGWYAIASESTLDEAKAASIQGTNGGVGAAVGALRINVRSPSIELLALYDTDGWRDGIIDL